MDIGGFRDMHRHRRCTQIIQGFTSATATRLPARGDLSHDVDILAEAGVLATTIQPSNPRTTPAPTLPPARRRKPRSRRSISFRWPRASALFSRWTLLKHSTSPSCAPAPAGHFSYRRVAWEMYLALQFQHPSLARHIRITDFTKPIDIFQR